MGKWKAKIVSRPRLVAANAWEIACEMVPDQQGLMVLAGVPVGSDTAAFSFPAHVHSFQSDMLANRVLDAPSDARPGQVVVCIPELADELRQLLAPHGIPVLLQKRLPWFERIADQVVADCLPPLAPGVTTSLDEWREYALALHNTNPWSTVGNFDAFVVEGGTADGSCIQMQPALDGQRIVRVFTSEDGFSATMLGEFEEDSTVVILVPKDDLSDAEYQACVTANLVLPDGSGVSVVQVQGGASTRITEADGLFHRDIVSLLLPVLGQFSALPRPGGHVAAPPHLLEATSFRRVEAPERAQRPLLPCEDPICTFGPLPRALLQAGAPSSALVIEVQADETEDCALVLAQCNRVVIEECTGCHEQRILAYEADRLVVEAGVVAPDAAQKMVEAYPDGQLNLALLNGTARGVANWKKSLVQLWQLPYEMRWVDHEGNPALAPDVPRPTSARGRVRTASPGRN